MPTDNTNSTKSKGASFSTTDSITGDKETEAGARRATKENQKAVSKDQFSDNNLTSILKKIEPDEQTGKASVGDIMSALESRGFGPLLFAPALIAVLPTGGIPGVPTVCGVVISLLSVQMIFGLEQPGYQVLLIIIDFDKDKLQKGVDIAEKVTTKIDKVSKPRIQKLSSETAKKAIAVVCVFAALAMIPLEAVPFAGYDTSFIHYLVFHWSNYQRWLLYGSSTAA